MLLPQMDEGRLCLITTTRQMTALAAIFQSPKNYGDKVKSPFTDY